MAKKPQVTVVACRDGPNSTSVVFTAVICSMMPAHLEARQRARRGVPQPNTTSPKPTTVRMTGPAAVWKIDVAAAEPGGAASHYVVSKTCRRSRVANRRGGLRSVLPQAWIP